MPKLEKESYERFANEYIVDLNATKAAIRAGYAESSARMQGSRLLTNDDILERVAELSEERNKRTQIDADYVLKRLVEIDQMDVLDILDDAMTIRPVSEWPPVWRQYLSGFDLAEMFEGRGDDREMTGVLKKIKWPDKVKNLELLGKHIKVQAFKEQVSADVSGNIQHSFKKSDYDAAKEIVSSKLPELD